VEANVLNQNRSLFPFPVMNKPNEEFPPPMRKALLWGVCIWTVMGLVAGGIATAIYHKRDSDGRVLILCVFVIFTVVVFSRKKSEEFLDNYDKDKT